MITRDFLFKIVEEQQAVIETKGSSMKRDVYVNIPEIQGFATIISGVRRCGKSTMLQQLLQEKHHDSLHINFDDSRLFDFTVTDFQKLDAILSETGKKTLMLDEIQVVKGWERYIRQKLDEGFNIYITGSNASLLSKEIGTSLTGRHLTTELDR